MVVLDSIERIPVCLASFVLDDIYNILSSIDFSIIDGLIGIFGSCFFFTSPSLDPCP